ncbi:unnamed protein product [Schistosoma margrebowiei]|uniref:Uncharacterized protein n=1 Tax=Schistosoma margrebowiei TaxID=48269 RepID=A0A183N320_9TREM|nr:unnamed protein product [Schistosoma margrebowiei]
MPFCPDNIEAWFCYAGADFSEHGVVDTRAQILAVVKALPREFNRYITHSMFTSDDSEPDEILKRWILKRGDLTDRQRLDQLFNDIALQHVSATDMLQRMREVIGLFKQLFLSGLPQQVQTVLVLFQNNALNKLTVSADRILEITKSSTTERYYEESFLSGCKNEFDLNSLADNIDFTVYNYLGHDILVCRKPVLTEHHSSRLKIDDKIGLLYDLKTSLEEEQREKTGHSYDYRPQKMQYGPHFCHHAQFHSSKYVFQLLRRHPVWRGQYGTDLHNSQIKSQKNTCYTSKLNSRIELMTESVRGHL